MISVPVLLLVLCTPALGLLGLTARAMWQEDHPRGAHRVRVVRTHGRWRMRP